MPGKANQTGAGNGIPSETPKMEGALPEKTVELVGDVLEKDKKNREDLKKDIKPVNPFEVSSSDSVPKSPFADSSLPVKEHEPRYKEEEMESVDDETQVVDNPVEVEGEFESNSVEPVNPFETKAVPAPTIAKKSLDNSPLDRRDDQVDVVKERVEAKKDVSPEEVGQTEEKNEDNFMNSTADDFGGGEEDNEAPGINTPESEESVVDVRPETLGGHVEVVDSEVTNAEPVEVEEFKQEFWEILEHAGLTKKKLLVILGVFVALIIFLIFFFSGGFNMFTLSKDDNVVVEMVSEDEIEVEVVESSGPENVYIGNTASAYPLVSAYVFGLEFSLPDEPIVAIVIGEYGNLSGVNAGFILGGIEETFESEIVTYFELLRKMDNIYNTDIYLLLDMSVDRRDALKVHLEEINSLIDEANVAYSTIVETMQRFNLEYEAVASGRDQYENQFFIAIDNLFGQSAFDYLDAFIKSSKDAIEIKSYFKTYERLRDFFVAYLQRLEPRYEDISANTEALIKGIRIFDVPSSNIDAIIKINNQ